MRISDWGSDVCSSDLYLGHLQPSADDVHVGLWRGDSALALLLEAVQDEHRFRKLDRVYRSIGAAGIVFDDLQHAGRSEEHTSELQSLMRISYAVFCLKKKKTTQHSQTVNYNTDLNK